MLKQILVPLDGSEDGWIALEQAIKIAKAEEKSALKGLFVVDSRLIEDPYYMATDPYGLMPEGDSDVVELLLELSRRFNEMGEQILSRAAGRCERAGVAYQAELAQDIVPNAILERAKDADLIVMGRHGAGTKRAGPLLGSTFEAVVRHATVPVMGVQLETSPMKRVLVAYDGSARARDALELGAHLAARHQGVVVMLTVDDGRADRLEVYKEGEALLRERGVGFIPQYREGHAAEVILALAEEEQCDLIALGAYGHSEFLEILFGRTVDDVMRQAAQAVLICR